MRSIELLYYMRNSRALPQKYREPIVLCYFEGMTYQEVARRLRRPIGTVKVLIAGTRHFARAAGTTGLGPARRACHR